MAKWWRHSKWCLKLIWLLFSYHTKKFGWQNFIKIERLSQELFMSEFQYENSTKRWCHQWLGLNWLKPRSFIGIIAKASETKSHQIRITKSKVIHIQIPVQKWEKLKSGKKFSGLQKGAISVLLIEEDFRDYQSGQDGLQIGEALRISNWGQKITIRGRDLKLGQRDFKLGQRLQIGARRISNQDRDYDAEQR